MCVMVPNTRQKKKNLRKKNKTMSEQQNIHFNSLAPLIRPTNLGGGGKPQPAFAHSIAQDLQNARMNNERFVSYTSDDGGDIYTYSSLLDEDNTQTRYPQLNNSGLTKGQKRFHQKVLDLEKRYKDA